MSIFRRDSGSSSTPPNPQPRERPESTSSSSTTLVAKGSKITGEVTGASPVHVAGELDGSIRVDQAVLISPEGRVDGDIRARTARIGGKVVGDVHATDKVEVTPSGSLEGNIRAPRVILEEGAFFKGQVEMAGDAGGDRGRRSKPSTGAAPSRPSSQPPAHRSTGGSKEPSPDRGKSRKEDDGKLPEDRKVSSGSASTEGEAT